MTARAPIRIVDTSLRDGNQSLWAALGITTGMAEAAGPILDGLGLEAIDFTSSTHLAMGVKFHRENPWERLDRMRAAAPSTPLSAITTGMRFMSWEKASETVMRMSLRLLARHGVRRLQIAEPMNDLDVTQRVARWAKEEGFDHVVAGVVFTESPVHTDERYRLATVAYARSEWIDSVYLKDPGGLLTDDRVRQLVPMMRDALGSTTLELHSHCTTGAAPQLYLTAAELGVDVLHTGIGPLANGTAQPSLEHLVGNLDALGIPVDVDRAGITRAAELFRAFADAQGLAPGVPTEYDLTPHRHQIPGGMMGTLKRQLAEVGLAEHLPQVIEETGRVRADLGYPIMVTPFSQFVGSQALMNVLAARDGQERYSRIPDEVVRFVLGHFGAPEGAIDPDLEQRVRDLPRARELEVAPEEPTLEELRATHPGLDEEELLLRLVLPQGQVDEMLAAGPAPVWGVGGSAASTAPASTATTLAEFLAGVEALPNWRHLAVRAGGENIELSRSGPDDA